jgi:uncharacterized protein YbcV (DUF1398 family)
MDQNSIAIFHECSAGSIAETLNFPGVLAKLAAVGAEGYHCDLYRCEKTYYLPDGSSHVESEPELDRHEFRGSHIALRFCEDGIKAALNSVQTGAITYIEFLRRIMAAGCVGYTVNLMGRRALYFGRRAEIYVEPFAGGN